MQNRGRRPQGTCVLMAVLCLASSAPLLAQTGSISGTVFDGSTAVDGLTVELYRANGEGLGSTSTAGGGAYAFTGLADDDYLVRVLSDPGRDLVGEYFDDVSEYDQDLAARFAISGGTAHSGVDFVLAHGGSFSGTLSGLVTGESIQLTVQDALTGRWRGGAASNPSTFTYTIESLAPGTYTLYADVSGTDRTLQWYDGRDRQSQADPIAVGADEDVAGIDLTLTPGTSISGTVTLVPDPGDGGATVQQVRMAAICAATYEWVLQHSPDASGAYSLSNLPPGSYVVQAESSWLGYVREMWVSSGGPAYNFEDGEPIAVDAGSPATGIDFDLQEGWTIQGHAFVDVDGNEIQDAGEPDVQWPWVNANQTDGGYWAGGGGDESGDYSVRGLVPGNYELAIESGQVDQPFVAEKWDGRLWSGPGDPVSDVGADGIETGVDFSVLQDKVISGKVFLDADGDQVQDPGEPGLNNVTIRAYDAATGRHEGHGAFGAGGVYSLGVRAGVYRVEAQPHQGTLLREYWQNVFFSDQATPVDVSSADATGIDFGLVDGAAYGTLRGRLVAAGTGAPVPGVHVQVHRYATGEHGWDAITGADGRFVATNLPPGSYSLYLETQGSNHAHDTDYVASWWSSTGLSNDPDSTHHRIDYPEIPGDGADLGDFTLEVGGSIAGTVTRAAGGAPVEGYWISCELRNDPLGRGFALGAETDANGDFVARGLLPGDYQVRTTGGVSGLANATYPDLVALASGDAATGIDFALEAGTSISGTVTLSPNPGDGGATLRQMWVDAVDPETHQHLTTGSVAADGTYVIDNLAPGSYLVKTEPSNTPYISELWTAQAAVPGTPPTIDYNQATLIAVDAGSPAAGIDFLLEEGRSISGHVFLDSLVENGAQDAGEPDVANASVQADLIGGGYGWGASTDGAGDFHLQGLVPGLYSVRVESTDPALPFVAQVWDGRGFADPPDPVDVTSSDATGIDFALVQRRVISGQVFLDLDDDQVRDAGEPPFSNASIRVHDFATGTHLAHGWIAGDGTYAVGVAAGTYRVDASPHQGNLLYEFWDDVYFQQDATPVDVSSADAPGVDFGLVDGAAYGTLRGQVTGSGPVPGVDVQAYRFDDDQHVASVTTDANGDFVFSGLPPGSYNVYFETSATNADNNTNFLSSYWSATGEPGVIDPNLLRVDFPLVPGDGTDLGAFQLASGGAISGTVFPPDGETLPPGLTVSAQSFESGGQHLPGAAVDDYGLYHIHGLPAPATYRVQADAWGTGFVSVYYLTASGSTFDHNTAAAVGVEPSVETSGIDLFLELGGSISGTVRGGGAPLANVGISVELVGDPLGRGYWSWAQTDAAGHYAVWGLPAGDYRVRVDQRDSDWANATYPGLVAAAPGVPVTGIDFDLVAAGWIHGRVTQSNGSPVVNIRVEASLYDTGWFSSDGYTDANGDYSIGALPQGVDYRLRVATRDGNDPQFFNFLEEYWDGHYPQSAADRVSMPGDGSQVESISPFDFVLELGGAISGLVTDGADGIQNVSVCANDVAGLGYGNCDGTDHNGFYIIRGLPPAFYRVDANPWPQDFVYELYDDTTDWNQATPVSVPAAPGDGPVPIVEHIDFTLAPAHRLSGTVSEADGVTPIANLNVWAEGLEVGWWDQAWTGSDGTYEIRGLPPGHYRVGVNTDGTDYIRQEQEADLSAGHATGVDFALELGAAVNGRVYVDADGSGAWDVGEERQDVYLDAYDFYSGEWMASATSDADGAYRIGGLAAGSYHVQLIEGPHNLLRMSWDHAFDGDPATPVAIVADGGGVLQDVSGIDFSAVQGYEIRGEVFYDENGDGVRQPAEPRLANWSVGAQRWAAGGHWNWGWIEEDDTYVIHSLAPGEYRLLGDAQQTPYSSEYYKLVGGVPLGTHRRSEADAVEIVDADLAGLDFSFELGGSVSGTVYDRTSGEPLANIDLWADAFDGDGTWSGTRSDHQGRYLLNGLPPGSYRVQTWDNQGVYVSQTYDEALFWEDASPAHVLARESVADPLATPLDFSLDEGGALAGVVYVDGNGNGAPDEGEGLGGMRVQVEEFSEPYRYFSGTLTEDDGTFRVGGLPPGYQLRAHVNADPTNYLRVIWDGGDDYGSPDWNDAAPLAVTAGGETAANFALELGGAIAGRVVGGDGGPIADHWVNANDYDGGPVGSGGQILGDGSYVIHGLRAGDYRVQSCGPGRCEFFDDQQNRNLAERVHVVAGETSSGIDFVFPKVPRIASGPTPASGERGSTALGVTVVAESLAGGLCAEPAVLPCSEISFGGNGLTVQGPNLDAPSGTIAFDLQIAADASLGAVSLSVVNRQLLEDSAASLAAAFEVVKAGAGDVPAASSQRLYVADNAAGELRVYGAADFSLLGTIDTCTGPNGLLLSPDGSFAYVTGNRHLSVIDTRLGEVGEEVARTRVYFSSGAHALAVTSSHLYALDNELANRIQIVDLTTWQVSGEIPLGDIPTSMRLDPTGRYLYVVHRWADEVAIIDLEPDGGGPWELLESVPLAAGTQPLDVAFTADGAMAYVAARRTIWAVDTTLALSDPAGAATRVLGVGSGRIDIAPSGSGQDLAFIAAGGGITVLDVSAGLAAPQVLRSFAAGLAPGGLLATADRLYLGDPYTLELYAVDTTALPDSPALSITRFDRRGAPDGLLAPGTGIAVAPTPGPPPASAPAVILAYGSPARNGAPFSVTLQGAGFATDAAVRLQGTPVRATVTSASPTELTVELPQTTPAGRHRVVVTNPQAAGNESGLSDTLLWVQPPTGFNPNQTVYANLYTDGGKVAVLEPGGNVDVIVTQPYPASMALSPDGRQAFVVQFDEGPWTAWEALPERSGELSVIDLDPDSPTFRQVVSSLPWIWGSFSPPVATTNLDHPNGVYLYVPNWLLSDTVSVIDVASWAEVDIDGDPATQSIPWQHPNWWGMDEVPDKLPGINRIELDGDVTDFSLQPWDVALTPDGNLLYVTHGGGLSIVDTVTRQVLATLTNQGNMFGGRKHLAITPADSGDGVFVYVTGTDASGNESIFVFEAGVLDDAAALVAQIVLPIQDESPREMSITAAGETIYVTARYAGALLAVDVRPATRGQITWICITAEGTLEGSSACAAADTFDGILHPVEASGDRLLYVSASFEDEVYVLDLSPGANRHQLITTLGLPGSPGILAVEPAAAVDRPIVATVRPGTGAPAGGDPVIISGANFVAGAEVLFGGNPATGVVVDNSYTLRATTPAGAIGPVEVKVVNPDGKTGKLANGFTYQLDITPPAFITPPWIATQTLVGAPDSETVTAEVRWRTDEASTSSVDYRQVGAPDFLQAGDGALFTQHVVVLTGLAPGTDHELRATSADVHGNAASSPEAPATEPFTTPSAPDLTAPVITSGPAVTPGTASAIVQWETQEPASSLVHYDAHVGDGQLERQAAGAGGLLQHSVTLTGLAANTEYEYKVLSVDASGNGPTASAIATFTTDALPDVTPPVITAGPEPSYLAQDLVIIVWETDELSSSFVNYGVSSVLEQGVIDVDPVKTHVIFLTNLLPGTAYGYQAGSTDASGNTVLTADPFAAASALGTVRLSADLAVGRATLAAGTLLATKAAAEGFTTPVDADTAPPVATVTATVLSHDRALVAAASDEPASLRVRYGATGLTETAFDPTFSAAPSLVLAGLAADTTYELEAELRDPKGNAAVVPLSFTTPAAPDTTPPVLTALATGPVGETTARISWQTDEPADATVRFGPQGGALSAQAGQLGLATSHSILLSGLAPGTAYAFAATSRDGSGNAGTATGSFTTAAAPPRITSVTPVRAAQGATVEVAINGAHFGAAPQVQPGAGVAVSSLAVNAVGSQIRAALTVDAAAAAGSRQITVATAAGSASAPFTIVDQTVPVVTIESPTAGQELQSVTVQVSGTLSELAAVGVNGVPATVSAGAEITYSATVNLPGAGPQGITATAVDLSGNRGNASVVVEVVNQPPVALCEDVLVALGPDCTAAASIDAGSYDPDGEITLTQEPAGPFGPGEHAVTLTAEDGSGASATCSATVVAHFDFVGFLPPLGGADDTGGSYGAPVRTVNRNSTLPVKFTLSCAGTPYLQGVHTLQTIQWSGDVIPGEPIDATPQDAATTGNDFRLDGEQWHFNLDLKGTGMGQGQWQLVATLSDSTRHHVWIQVK